MLMPLYVPIVNTCPQISSLNIKLILKYLCLSVQIMASNISSFLIVRNERDHRHNKYQFNAVSLQQRKGTLLLNLGV